MPSTMAFVVQIAHKLSPQTLQLQQVLVQKVSYLSAGGAEAVTTWSCGGRKSSAGDGLKIECTGKF